MFFANIFSCPLQLFWSAETNWEMLCWSPLWKVTYQLQLWKTALCLSPRTTSCWTPSKLFKCYVYSFYTNICIYVHYYAVCCRSFSSLPETLFLQNVLNAGPAFQPSDTTALISDSLERPADVDNKAIDLLLGRYFYIFFPMLKADIQLI